MKKKVLFICVHNSARSQMAAAFVNQLCAAQFEAYSAGIEPGKLNPVVVEAMHEIGVDISGNQTWSVSDILKFCKNFAHVVTVCNDADAERCPVLPGAGAQFHWNFPDPSALSGSHSYKLARTAKSAMPSNAKWSNGAPFSAPPRPAFNTPVCWPVAHSPAVRCPMASRTRAGYLRSCGFAGLPAFASPSGFPANRPARYSSR
jgi:arsenate reductase